ncbi:MAG: hypothetical protein IJ644_11020 [Oscillospiraceae bacterium]|nr:hypothetical protein [Oscillospiraceae bacterium]
MIQNLYLHLYHENNFVRRVKCLSLSLDREVYTPYESATAEFLSDGNDCNAVDRIGIYFDNTCIFLGLADNIRQYHRQNASLVRIQSRSFTSLLTQNELAAGLHSNLTMTSLMTDFYQFPSYITYENLSGNGYIFVKSGNTMWDGVVSFGYKLTGHYPYVLHNHICLSAPQASTPKQFQQSQVLEYGTVTDTIKLISHYHMEDISGNPDVYQQENSSASAFNIVRHKQISFDNSFLHDPNDALTFRNLYSRRGCNSSYLVYDGFQNEMISQHITFGTHIQNETVCRVRTTFGTSGFRTRLDCYHDGFYNLP